MSKIESLKSEIKEYQSIIDQKGIPADEKDAAMDEVKALKKEIESLEAKEAALNDMREQKKKKTRKLVGSKNGPSGNKIKTVKKKVKSTLNTKYGFAPSLSSKNKKTPKKKANMISFSKNIKSFNKGRSASDIVRDRQRKALKPGKRTSAEGNIYYEKRSNRGDVSKKDRLEGGGSLYNKGGNTPKNLVEKIKFIDPGTIKEFGITEIFVQDGEVRVTSNYDIPMDYAASIEKQALNIYYQDLLNEYDLLGVYLDEAKEEKDTKRAEELRAQMKEVESKIHKYENGYAKGGGLENNEEFKQATIQEAIRIANIAHANGIVASDLTYEKFADEINHKTKSSYAKIYLKLAYELMKKKGFAGGGSVYKEGGKVSKFAKTMREFKAGTLKSSSGDPVTEKRQALAMAFAESRKEKMQNSI